jgi:hypothetical protein
MPNKVSGKVATIESSARKIDSEVRGLYQTVLAIENSASKISDIFDNVKSATQRPTEGEGRQAKMCTSNGFTRQTEESITDLKSRSMRGQPHLCGYSGK